MTFALNAPAAAQGLFPAKKDKQKILFNAQNTTFDNEKNLVILRGQVQIVSDKNVFTCNEAVVLLSKNEIVAVGNVVMTTQKSTIQADKIIYNSNDQKGRIFNGVILSGKVLMQAEYIEKIGEDTYVADDAYFTACTTCPASWSFTADHVEATVEGYAYMSNPWLNILEVPTLYSPYLVIPLKNKRQTGLLTPSFESSTRSGASIQIPYFWAINRSQDATFGAQIYKKRGLQGLFNYRYRLSETSSGELDTGFLRDQDYDNRNRWFASYSHYLELPNNYVQRTTMHMTSDLEYPQDFTNQFPFLGEPALDNRTSLTKSDPDYHLSLDSSYYMSLIQQNIDESKEASVHRLPDIRFAISDKKVSKDWPLYFRFDTQYVNFARQGLGYDSPFIRDATNTQQTVAWGEQGYRPISASGVFDPATDKIRSGQRFDIQPYFYSPLRVLNNTVDVTPFLGYRHTQYILGALNEGQNFDFYPSRNYTIMGVKTSTELSRVYEGETNKYRHSIIPEITYQSIPWSYQKDHPFFGTTDQIPYFMQTQPLQDLDLSPGGRGLQFDYEDRVVGRRLMNFGLTNRVVRKNNVAYGSRYDQTFLFGLSQAYDFMEAKKADGLPWQDIRALLKVRWGKIDSFTEAFNFPYHKVTNVSSRLRFNVVDTNYFELIYSNYLNVPARPADVDKNERLQSLWASTGFNYLYAALAAQAEYSLEKSNFQRFHISAEIIPPGRCWTISSEVTQAVDPVDDLSWKVLLNFKFGN
jgi:LPS-assembly protein